MVDSQKIGIVIKQKTKPLIEFLQKFETSRIFTSKVSFLVLIYNYETYNCIYILRTIWFHKLWTGKRSPE